MASSGRIGLEVETTKTSSLERESRAQSFTFKYGCPTYATPYPITGHSHPA